LNDAIIWFDSSVFNYTRFTASGTWSVMSALSASGTVKHLTDSSGVALTGSAADFSGNDFTGKVALIKRGTETFVDKVLRAQAAGAVAVILYNTYGTQYISGDFGGTSINVTVPTLIINQVDAATIIGKVVADPSLVMSISGTFVKKV
jgi:hypothetical protein